MATQVSEPETKETLSTWHLSGSAWLAAGVVGAILLIGLIYLLLSAWPVLQNLLAIMAGILVSIAGFVGVSEKKTFFPKTSHFVATSRPAQVSLAGVLIVSILLWGGFGWPRVRAILCGPLGCPAPGVKRFAIDNWHSLTPGVSKYEAIWTQGTRNVLYDKLSQVQGLQGIALDSPQVAENVYEYLEWWIQGDFQKINEVQLSARLLGKGGAQHQSVAVHRAIDEEGAAVDSAILELQNQLAQEILRSLGIQVTATISDAISNTPTRNGEALRLNNEAVGYYQRSELGTAESLLRAAIALDPKYADAYSNLGAVLSAQQNYTDALSSIQRAIVLLPTNPLYHHALAANYESQGKYEAAVLAYRQAIALDPGFVRAYNNLGFTYLQMGALNEAQAILQTGLQLEPGRSSLHKNLGRVYLQQNDVDKAVGELRQAVELSRPALDGIHVEALYYLAIAYQGQGDDASACASLQEYTPLAQGDVPERTQEAHALWQELGCS